MPQAEDPTIEKIKHAGGRPPKYTSVEELQAIIDQYFVECDPHWIDEEYWDYPFVEITTGKGSDRRTVRVRDKNAEMTLQTRKVKTEQVPYTMADLAICLNLSRQGLMEYKAKDEFSDAIKAARAKVGAYNERQLHSGRNVTGAIFNLKVNFAYKENDEENHPPDNPIVFINNVPMPPDEMPLAEHEVPATEQ